MAKESTNKMNFFGGLTKAFKEQLKTDVWLRAGDGTDIPAHKLILVSSFLYSEYFHVPKKHC